MRLISLASTSRLIGDRPITLQSPRSTEASRHIRIHYYIKLAGGLHDWSFILEHATELWGYLPYMGSTAPSYWVSLAGGVTASRGLSSCLFRFSQILFIALQHTPTYASVTRTLRVLGITPTDLEQDAFCWRLPRAASITVYSRFYTPRVTGGWRLMSLQNPAH